MRSVGKSRIAAQPRALAVRHNADRERVHDELFNFWSYPWQNEAKKGSRFNGSESAYTASGAPATPGQGRWEARTGYPRQLRPVSEQHKDSTMTDGQSRAKSR